jgi:hypothetical protein
MKEINLPAPITKEELEAILPEDLKNKWDFSGQDCARRFLLIKRYMDEKSRKQNSADEKK